MKIEILKTLKGSTTWRKGTVFDDTVSPIPGDILREVDSGSNAVKMIATEKPIVAVEPEIEIKETAEEPCSPNQGLSEMVERTMAMAKPQENTSPAHPEKEEPFKCTKCDWTGKTEAALKRHNTMNHR